MKSQCSRPLPLASETLRLSSLIMWSVNLLMTKRIYALFLHVGSVLVLMLALCAHCFGVVPYG